VRKNDDAKNRGVGKLEGAKTEGLTIEGQNLLFNHCPLNCDLERVLNSIG
jgi:hypothetical protein